MERLRRDKEKLIFISGGAKTRSGGSKVSHHQDLRKDLIAFFDEAPDGAHAGIRAGKDGRM